MTLRQARKQYKLGNITFNELHIIFTELASKKEKDAFWDAPVFDRAGVVQGLSQDQLDSQWNKAITRAQGKRR